MTSTHLGLLTGIALGMAAAFGGFGAFLVVLVLGLLGLLVGRYLDGKLDLSQLVGRDKV
jgi:nitrate/nitrite transporter NarK